MRSLQRERGIRLRRGSREWGRGVDVFAAYLLALILFWGVKISESTGAWQVMDIELLPLLSGLECQFFRYRSLVSVDLPLKTSKGENRELIKSIDAS